MFQQYTEVLR